MRDIEAIWFGQGAELARRMEALAADIDARGWALNDNVAAEIRSVLHADYNPLPDQLPSLGDPPTLRPAVPRQPVLTLPPPFGEHVRRRGQDPGE